MAFLGVIPARGGSKGIADKNIVDVCGKPLIYYTVSEAKKSKLDKIVVSTDCEKITEVCVDLGVEVIQRPQELAMDNTPTLPVLQHALDHVGDPSISAVVTLQPTSPLRRSEHIDQALNLFNSDPECDSLVSVVKTPHNFVPSSLMKKEGDYLVNCVEPENVILRRQEKPLFYARNGAAIYITRVPNIEKFIFGGKILGYEMSAIDSFDIDEYEDLEIVKSIMMFWLNGTGQFNERPLTAKH